MKHFSQNVLCLLLLVFSLHSTAAPSQQQLLTVLSEAEDYARVLPSKAKELLQQHERHISSLTTAEQIEWHLIMFRAAQQLLDLQQMEQSLNSMMQWHKDPAFSAQLPRIVNSLGVWFRKSGFAKEAQQAYFCALENSDNPRRKLSMLANIAVTYRNLGDLDNAIFSNKLASQFAKQLGSELHQAVIHNNLGVLYLNQRQFTPAADHLLSALNINQTMSRRSGQILSGINLMLVYLEQKQLQHYQRIYPRVKRLIQSENNEARMAYLQLVNSLYSVREGHALTPKQRAVQQRNFYRLGDRALQKTLYPYALELGLKLQFDPNEVSPHYSGAWLKQIAQCRWDIYQQPNFVRNWTLQALIQKSPFVPSSSD